MVTGTRKRDSSVAELENFESVASEDMPWKGQIAEVPSGSHEPMSKLPSSSCNAAIRQQLSPSKVQSQVKYEPQPSPAKFNKVDPEYENTMNAVIVSIHKASGEWHRKHREYAIAVVKSKQHETTKDSKVEKALEGCVQRGNNMLNTVGDIEALHATKALVSHDRQVECKNTVSKIYELIKAANKLKLLVGHTIASCASRPLLAN